MKTRVCKKCSIEKDINEFSKQKEMKDGYRNACKKCEYEMSKRYKNKCLQCDNDFKTHKKTQKYCSRHCESEYTKENGLRKKEKHWNWQGGEVEYHCDYCGDKISQRIGQFSKFKYHYCSKKCNGKHAEQLGRFSGENSASYNYDLSDEDRVKRRKTLESKKWTKEVYEKDNYTCVVCGYRGKGLVAHHLDGYNWCKEKRTDINNGVTLCGNHHEEFHKEYGYGNNTKAQFGLFLDFKRKESSSNEKISIKSQSYC
ncbi:HNH endonuclease signature motif containing protein [Bacillus sp. FSL R12-0074]|uniref:HNH endonuclease signature motif containing protein n=1 Tax=Bacillus sp. FSL R12-0074 TaxID=2954664 RepID=UPI0030F64222